MRRRERSHRFTQKQPPAFVSALRSLAAVETAKNQLSRDFCAVRFSTFSTVSTQRRHHRRRSSLPIGSGVLLEIVLTCFRQLRSEEMRRREFIGGIAATILPVMARAQQSKRLAYVSWQSPTTANQIDFFREGLRQFGYVEGQNIELESYFTDANKTLTKSTIQSLVQKKVDVLIVRVTPTAHIAKDATQTIPVVMIVADPIATGLVQSLSRPGGNLTGISLASPDIIGKKFEVLREIKPDIRCIGFLGLSDEQQTGTFLRETAAAGQQLGLKVVSRLVDSPNLPDETVFASMKREGAEAIIVQPVFSGHQDRVVELAMTLQLPVVSDFPVFARAGALFTFGVEEADIVRRAAFRGAKPADLPVEQPTKFQLVINAQSAKRLNMALPPLLLSRADEVIE
jgi:putative tryptophan/tyrosine transport system substrate-binding protein